VDQVLIVNKRTKFELDQERYPDKELYTKITQIQNNSYEKIFNSHLRQLESRDILQREIFPKGKFIYREELESLSIDNYDLIIALGGDNHFTYVAHHIQSGKILGCNSDEYTSKGVLLSFTAPTLKETVEKNWSDIQEEKWSLIQGTITYPNGMVQKTVSCVNEISIRNSSPDLISRYIIEYNGIIEEQKSSGLLLCTGAGSTGWYSSCKGFSSKEKLDFPKNSNYFRVFSRELSRRARKNFKFTDFQVFSTIKIISEMNGGISIDSLSERIYPFPPGSIAEFGISPTRLRVITKKNQKEKI
jgi:NAD kinase